jgi:hypothetical protein
VSATIEDVAKKKPEPSAEQEADAELVRLAKEQGLSLTGPDGLLKQLTKSVIESALAEEIPSGNYEFLRNHARFLDAGPAFTTWPPGSPRP